LVWDHTHMFFSKRFTFSSLSIAIATIIIVASPVLGKVNIVTTIPDFASIAKSVGGDHVNVTALLKGNRDLHHVFPRPSMVVKVRNAHILMRVGMFQDTWIDSIIDTSRNSKVFVGADGYMDCSVGINKLEVPIGKVDGRQGDVHVDGNPHYWLDPLNGIIVAKKVRDRLVLIDPDNYLDYDANYKAFAAKISSRIPEWQEKLTWLQNAGIVSYHKTWSYFAKRFGFGVIDQLEPIPGVAPTSRHLNDIMWVLKPYSNKVIISANYFNPAPSKQLAKKANAKVYFLPSNAASNTAGAYEAFFDDIITKLTYKQL